MAWPLLCHCWSKAQGLKVSVGRIVATTSPYYRGDHYTTGEPLACCSFSGQLGSAHSVVFCGALQYSAVLSSVVLRCTVVQFSQCSLVALSVRQGQLKESPPIRWRCQVCTLGAGLYCSEVVWSVLNCNVVVCTELQCNVVMWSVL